MRRCARFPRAGQRARACCATPGRCRASGRREGSRWRLRPVPDDRRRGRRSACRESRTPWPRYPTAVRAVAARESSGHSTGSTSRRESALAPRDSEDRRRWRR